MTSRGRRRELPKVLEQDERKRFLATFNKRYQGSFRNLVAVRLMLDCGLRVSECVSVRPEHINMASCKLVVRDGKGGVDRNVWMTDGLRDLVADWLESDLRPESEWLICTRDGGQVDPRQLRDMVKRQAQKADVAEWERVSPHTLRHTFATDMYRQTKDLVAVQHALGHASIQTTQIYAHLANGEVEEAMRNLRDSDEAQAQDDAEEIVEGLIDVLPPEVIAALRRRLEQ